jgi:small conductance mechanosensitive channel
METIKSNLFSFDLMSQYGTDFALGLGMQVIAGILTIIIGFWLSGRASRLVITAFSKIDQIDKTIIPMIGALVRYAGMTLTLVVALGKFGVETTSIIAVLGAAGLAIGLALQGTLSNVAAGLMLIFLRPFKVGDWIEAAGMSGIVREIGLFTTVIDTFDRVFISIPNSSIWSSNIVNHSRYGERRLDLDIGVAYDSSLDDTEAALMKLAKDSRILATPPPRFLVVSYADSAIIVRLRVYANYADFFDLNYDLHRQLKDTLAAHNVSIPYPHRVVHHVGGPSIEGPFGEA